MRNFILALVAFASWNANSQISCHEVNVSIAGIVTVKNIYVCCGAQFINYGSMPPIPCSFVNKKTFTNYTDGFNRQAGSGSQTINIRDLTDDEAIIRNATEIIVEKSSVFEYDGKQCSIKPRKYSLDSKGDILFEIQTVNK